jgi:hypothetical protein
MLISQKTRAALRVKAEKDKNKYPRLGAFLDTVTDTHPKVMALGSLGPDLAYFEKLVTVIVEGVWGKGSRPKSLEPWSYQMHSKDPNILPLKMFEIIWKESTPSNTNWEDDDHIKLAFLCGFLTHMAADHVIHPVINQIAGPYYKSGANRAIHQASEVSKDLYLLSRQAGGSLTWEAFRSQQVGCWCGMAKSAPGIMATVWASIVANHRAKRERLDRLRGKDVDRFADILPTSFRYMLQKAFVEAYGIGPSEASMVRWVCGTSISLRMSALVGPYKDKYKNLFEPSGQLIRDGDAFLDYIELRNVQGRLGQYDAYVDRAVELAVIYITALYRLYEGIELDDDDRNWFKTVVRNADLSGPLDVDLFLEAADALVDWEHDSNAQTKMTKAMAQVPSSPTAPSPVSPAIPPAGNVVP